MKPLCFVLMPFGRKSDAAGRVTDFDRVYAEIIKPAIEAAEMEPIRADEERVGGAIHKPMYERLILCDYAIADVSAANPNVYYELGIRHAVRPRSTLILFGEGTLLPFDIGLLRGLPYQTDSAGIPTNAAANGQALTRFLTEARAQDGDDSPLFQMIDGMPRTSIDLAKADVFRERVTYSREFKSRLAAARKADGVRTKAERQAAVRAIAQDPSLTPVQDVESGLIVDLFLSLRDVEAFDDMLGLYALMPKPLQKARLVLELRAFALGRLRRFDEAAEVLRSLIDSQGPSSETNGLLGRVYKDLWKQARAAGDALSARGHLKSAIAAYAAGFEADWRDSYPGINAVTLMEMLDRPDPRQAELLPVVRYAAVQRARADGGYWEHATVMEAAVLARAEDDALDAASSASAAATQPWELGTTLDNLAEIRAVREARGEDVAWLVAIERSLQAKKGLLEGG